MHNRVVVAAGACVATTLLLGCGPAAPRDCTLVGTSDSLSINVGELAVEAATVRACLDGSGCAGPFPVLRPTTAAYFVTGEIGDQERSVTAVFSRADGSELVRAGGKVVGKTFEVNGPGCGKSYGAAVRYERATGRLVGPG